MHACQLAKEQPLGRKICTGLLLQTKTIVYLTNEYTIF